jgi:hypothetical protein
MPGLPLLRYVYEISKTPFRVSFKIELSGNFSFPNNFLAFRGLLARNCETLRGFPDKSNENRIAMRPFSLRTGFRDLEIASLVYCILKGDRKSREGGGKICGGDDTIRRGRRMSVPAATTPESKNVAFFDSDYQTGGVRGRIPAL